MRDAHGFGYWYDHESAELAVEFCSDYLVHIKGEWRGEPFELADWQADRIVRPTFGWRHRCGRDCREAACNAFHPRRYRIVYLEVPKKNGKSALAAAMALKLTFADQEPAAEVYSAAADREQAAIVFGIAQEQVEFSPELTARCRVLRRTINVHGTGSFYRVLSSDASTKHGFNVHGCVIDELHAHKRRDLVDTLVAGRAGRRQPLIVFITTAGYDRESICWEYHQHALKVLEWIEAGEPADSSVGIRDDAFLPVIYAAEKDDPIDLPEVWAKANPLYPTSPKHDYLVEEAARAKAIPAKRNEFKRLHLNIWTQQVVKWIPLEQWDACRGPIDYREIAEHVRGRECWAGLDLAQSRDLSAWVLLFPPVDEHGNTLRKVSELEQAAGPAFVLPFFWLPEENMRERVARDRVPYDVWAEEGLINITPGNVTDFAFIRRDVLRLAGITEPQEETPPATYGVQETAFDRTFATGLSLELAGDGLEMVPFGQGFLSMAPACEHFERLIMGRQLAHGGHPIMRWMIDNLAVATDAAGNKKPDKKKSTERIDGAVALVMAAGRLFQTDEEDDGPSKYETEGPTVLG